MKRLICVLFVLICWIGISSEVKAFDLIDINADGKTGLPEAIYSLQVAAGKQQPGWQCSDDDLANGIYRICNYFPLKPGNRWMYTTGDRNTLRSNTLCSSGYSGIKYGTATYEYEQIMQNGENGLMFSGCQYERPDENLIDMNTTMTLLNPEMHIGQTIASEHKGLKLSFSTTLTGSESVTVPSGTYTALRVEINTIDSTPDNSCSFKTTLWLAKGIGPVKIARTDANPGTCGGCMFVCRPDNDLDKVNTPAELISAEIDGQHY